MCRRSGLSLVALLRVRMLHRQMVLLCLSLLLLCLCLCLLLLGLLLVLLLLLLLLLGLLLLHHSLMLTLLGLLLLLLLSQLHLLLSKMGWQLHRVHLLLLVVLERLLVLHHLCQLCWVHLLQLLRRHSHCLCLLDQPLPHDVLLLLLKLSHHGWVATGLLKLLLLLHELLLLLGGHVHGSLCANHALASHALTWHAHPSSRMLISHSSNTGLHASYGSRLHAHHGARLANVRRPRYTGVHLHLLAHVLVRSRRHARVAVGHARVHIVSGRVCRHHFAVA